MSSAAEMPSTFTRRLNREAALLEAVRVRPNPKAMAYLRDFYEAMADGGSRTDRLQAGALCLLIEMHDKVNAVLAEFGSAP